MRRNLFISFVIIAISLLIYSCKEEESFSVLTYDIFFKYINPEGNTPEAKLNEGYSSDVVKMSYDKDFSVDESSNEAVLLFDNVRLVDNNLKSYDIAGIIPSFVNSKGDWQEDTQYLVDFEKTNQIYVMLVIDNSKSLVTNLDSVKTYLKGFVNEMFLSTSDSVHIGIASFSDQVDVLEITDDKSEILNYIENMTAEGEAAFYSAVDMATTMLQNEETAKSKVILTFTDGVNNVPTELTSATLVTNLIDDTNFPKISCFNIGYMGNAQINRKELSDLAVNGGVYQFPENMEELKTTFEQYAEAISKVYYLYYRREMVKVSLTDPIYLKFAIEPK